MKKLILISTFLSSLVFSSACFAGWTLVGKNSDGDRLYIDFESIQIKNKWSVFYWQITDYAKPTKYGDLSSKTFHEANCGIPRQSRGLAYNFYPQPMAQGMPSSTDHDPSKWWHPPPGSPAEFDLKIVCALAKKK